MTKPSFWVLLNRPGDLNEATRTYIGLFEQAAADMGYEVRRSANLPRVSTGDWIMALDAKALLLARLLRPRAKLLCWFQGVIPEEAALAGFSPVRTWYWRVFEFLALRLSTKIVLVSEAMRRHYRERYGIRRDDALVIPCFNRSEYVGPVFEGRYRKLSFVYAGSMANWQRVDRLLDVFRCLRGREPSASLLLLTEQTAIARQLVAARGGEGVCIETVRDEALDARLSEMSFAFLIRDEHIVNRVATPTKFSTYLSNGVIPVMSDVFADFHVVLAGMRHVVALSPELDNEAIVARILDFHRLELNAEAIRDEYQNILSQWFDRKRHIQQIKDKVFAS